jgi:hypothetical protein
VSDEPAHRASARAALDIATALRDLSPEWALVPLFYSAMHLVHAKLAADGHSGDYGHPKRHFAVRATHTGDVIKWGTIDVVAMQYRQISAAYRELHTMSVKARYEHLNGLKSTDRFWRYYDEISDFTGGLPLT